MKFVSFLFEISRKEANRIIWLILLVVSLMGMADIAPANIFKMALPLWLKWTCVFLSAAMKATIFIIILALCRKNKILKVLAGLLIFVYSLMSLVNFISFEFYEFGISHKLFMLVSETNKTETLEFFGSLGSKIRLSLSWQIIVAIAAICLIGTVIIKLKPKQFMIFSGLLSVLGFLSFVFLVFSTFHGKNAFSILARTGKTAIEVYKENRKINSLMAKLEPYKDADKVSSEKRAFNLIVVYGESADPHHMSLYGYPLSTTPVMEAMKDSIYVFTDALASAKQTRDNMERLLTLKKDDEADGWWEHAIIFDIFKAAGYRTFWLSNQERSGVFSNATAAICTRADVTKYIGKTSSEDPLLQKYDEALLPELTKALADTTNAKWIGLHLYGSHVAYQNRFPESRHVFKPEDIRAINRNDWMDASKYKTTAYYDNSILYTDSVVGKMFDIVAHQEEPSIIIYLSDHGENVYDDRDYNGRDLKHVRIPFVVYANESYRKANPEIMKAIEKATSLKISSANLPYTLMTLTGTSCPDYDPTSDMLSPDFKERDRYVENEKWPY